MKEPVILKNEANGKLFKSILDTEYLPDKLPSSNSKKTSLKPKQYENDTPGSTFAKNPDLIAFYFTVGHSHLQEAYPNYKFIVNTINKEFTIPRNKLRKMLMRNGDFAKCTFRIVFNKETQDVVLRWHGDFKIARGKKLSKK